MTARCRHERGDSNSGAPLSWFVLLVLGISISVGLRVLVLVPATEGAISMDSDRIYCLARTGQQSCKV